MTCSPFPVFTNESSRQTSKIQTKFLVGAAHHAISHTLLPPLWTSLVSSTFECRNLGVALRPRGIRRYTQARISLSLMETVTTRSFFPRVPTSDGNEIQFNIQIL
ncbi:hypothetical protein ARMSODRAFT_967910, partial [Armillaria solidipes]